MVLVRALWRLVTAVMELRAVLRLVMAKAVSVKALKITKLAFTAWVIIRWRHNIMVGRYSSGT